MRISRDRGLAAYAYTMLDLGVAAAMTRSRDRWARRLAAATLSTGGGGNVLRSAINGAVLYSAINGQPLTSARSN